MSWLPKTLADEEGGNAMHQCACGRRVPSDMMVDVTALDASIRRIARGGSARGDVPAADYLCDGCRERLIREGAITRESFVRALGAPRAVTKKAAKRDAARGRAR